MLASPTQTAGGDATPATAARRLPTIVFAVVAAALVAVTLIEPAEIYDEGLIVSGAAGILRGEHPYLDFNSGYPPAQFYTVAAAFRVFGTTLLAERVWDSLWRLATVGAALWLAREASRGKPRLVPLACCAAVTGAAGFRLYPMITAMLPCLCGLASVLAFRRTRDLRWIGGAGLLIGAATLYRHDLAACCAAVALGCVWRDRRAVLCLAAGALAVMGPAISYLLVTVPLHDLRHAFVDFPALNAAARHLPLPTDPFPLLRDLVLPIAIVVTALFEARRAPALVPLAAAAGLTLLLATQRLDQIHAFPAVIFSLVILATRASDSLAGRVLLAASLLIYGAVPLYESISKARLSASVLPSGIERAGPVRIAPDQARAIRYIQDHAAPGEGIYVGTSTHTRISYNDALFSFLADRPQTTRYRMWIPGETNCAPVQAEIVASVERQAVRYAVLFDTPPLDEPNGSSVESGVTLLDGYLQSHYRPAQAFGRYHVLERAR